MMQKLRNVFGSYRRAGPRAPLLQTSRGKRGQEAGNDRIGIAWSILVMIIAINGNGEKIPIPILMLLSCMSTNENLTAYISGKHTIINMAIHICARAPLRDERRSVIHSEGDEASYSSIFHRTLLDHVPGKAP